MPFCQIDAVRWTFSCPARQHGAFARHQADPSGIEQTTSWPIRSPRTTASREESHGCLLKGPHPISTLRISVLAISVLAGRAAICNLHPQLRNVARAHLHYHHLSCLLACHLSHHTASPKPRRSDVRRRQSTCHAPICYTHMSVCVRGSCRHALNDRQKCAG